MTTSKQKAAKAVTLETLLKQPLVLVIAAGDSNENGQSDISAVLVSGGGTLSPVVVRDVDDHVAHLVLTTGFGVIKDFARIGGEGIVRQLRQMFDGLMKMGDVFAMIPGGLGGLFGRVGIPQPR